MSVAAFVLAAAVAVGAPGVPQSAAADSGAGAARPGRSLDAAAKQAVVDAAVKLLTEAYIYPDVGRRAAEVISRKLAAGDYDAITTPDAFARRLSDDLGTVTRDKHLRVSVEGQDEPAEGPPPRSELGFARVDVLEGNIGYVEITGFVDKGLFSAAADKAMRLAAGTDALIFDLRPNRGGDPASVAYLASFFFDPKTPLAVSDMVWRNPGTEEYRRDVFQTEPTPLSYLDKPVVLLTGAGTFSGGEHFAYDMQSLKRATLVGEVTGGGANPGDPRRLPSGLSLFLPTGRAENPITHSNWEGRGVQPDVPVPASEAFAVAYQTARKAAGKHPLVANARPSGPDAVLDRRLLVPRTTAQPGSEAAVRRSVAEFQAGTPSYDRFSPFLAEQTRAQLPLIHPDIAALGPLQSVTFVEVGPMGDDLYDLKFARGEWLWSVLLGEDGRIIMSGFGPK